MMDFRRLLVAMGTVLVLAFTPIAANAQDTFTFSPPVGNDGLWGLAINWVGGPPGEFPDAGDKAIIPDGKTCRVEDANGQNAEIVEVQSTGTGGTLIIKTTLTIDTNNDGTHDTPKLTVNGKVRFEGTDATLVYGNAETGPNFVLDGAGTVLADGSSSHKGIIKNKTGDEHIIEIKSALTLRGSLEIRCENTGISPEPGAKYDGSFLVNNAADAMEFGPDGFARVRGEGTFEVSAGSMKFTLGFIPQKTFDGSFKVSGAGTMTFTSFGIIEFNMIPLQNDGSFEVSGGTLRMERAWQSHGGIEFRGGKIEVVPLISASFLE